ncbi:hypothetical protein [Microvirga puerhi]|uniref:Peptidase S74 domain-containing protein n=1 Tax=Microvirga puerhi TaxID=2876078 RepID=A0ABS7VIP1_9HYPH|nr:hypothetical protein [Microvirga puerhi]MBZ6075362.1 hypothetical protein [Microvirga puerhi]
MRLAASAAALVLAFATPAAAQSTSSPSSEATVTRAEIRELLDAVKATAKASRENVDYTRVVPDILFQILAKLDKIEDKLDKVETTLAAGRKPAQKKN